jgi:hypothetical protein
MSAKSYWLHLASAAGQLPILRMQCSALSQGFVVLFQEKDVLDVHQFGYCTSLVAELAG